MDKDKKLAWDLCCAESWLTLYESFSLDQIASFNSAARSKNKTYTKVVTEKRAEIIHIKLLRGL